MILPKQLVAGLAIMVFRSFTAGPPAVLFMPRPAVPRLSLIVVLNQPPVAQCQNLTIFTDTGSCTSTISVDSASFDPDGDPITLNQVPAGPYSLGSTDVTLTVTDDPKEARP